MTTARLEVDLPSCWWCLGLQEQDRSEQLDQLLGVIDVSSDLVDTMVRATSSEMSARGAELMLIHPAGPRDRVSICGALFTTPPLPVSGEELYAALAAEGEPVALGDLDGLPIVSHIRREPPDDVMPLPLLHVSYFICTQRVGIAMTFVAPEITGGKRVVREVAKIVSAARVVHSDSGCPVSLWTPQASPVVAVRKPFPAPARPG